MKTQLMPFWAAGFLLAASMLTSCEEKLQPTFQENETKIIGADSTGIVKQGTFEGQQIRYKEINGQAVWQGDILLTPEQLGENTGGNARMEGAGLVNKDYRWPDAVIPFEIGSGLPAADIQLAIKEWQDETPVRFVPRTNQGGFKKTLTTGWTGANAMGAIHNAAGLF